MRFLWIVSLCYLFSAVLFWAHLWVPRRKLSAIGYLLAMLGVAAQTAMLVALYLEGKTIPSGIETSLLLFSWLVAGVYVIADIRRKLTVLGAFAAPLALLLTLPSLIIPERIVESTPSFYNPWIFTHVILVLLGGAIFAVAFISGLLYLFQEQRLKSKRMGSFITKLPSLTKLDSLNNICLLIGFPILTLGLAVGVISAKQVWGVFWKWDQKEIWTVGTWVIFASLMYARLVFGWKGKKAALGAILGFFAIIASVLVSSYFAQGTYGLALPY